MILSIVVNHDFNDRISLSGAWVYGTGNAVTLNTFEYPIGFYDFNFGGSFDVVQSGGERNAFRMTDYHRLDLSLRVSRQLKRYEETWVFGVYNAYFHRKSLFHYCGS